MGKFSLLIEISNLVKFHKKSRKIALNLKDDSIEQALVNNFNFVKFVYLTKIFIPSHCVTIEVQVVYE